MYPTYEYEDAIKEAGYRFVAGVDEVGRGCGAGPVVASAVIIPTSAMTGLIGKAKDSKKLSHKKRVELFDIIRNSCYIGTGIVDNNTIDEVNILEATKIAMMKALNELRDADYALIDGTVVLPYDIPQTQIIKGDNKSISIAAASIIAKVTRDEIMKALDNAYPQYGWAKNKAYLTKDHKEAIVKYGPCEYHRLTFRGVGR